MKTINSCNERKSLILFHLESDKSGVEFPSKKLGRAGIK